MSRVEKTKFGIGRCAIALVLAATPMVGGRAMAAPITWMGLGADAKWSNVLNWDTLPATSGEDIYINAAVGKQLTASVDSAWAASGSVNSLNFGNYNAGSPNAGNDLSYTVNGGTGFSGLTIGAGGITNYTTKNQTINLGVNGLTLGADQMWSTASAATLTFDGNISSAANRVLTFSSSSASQATYRFNSGSSAGFVGSTALNGSTLWLNTASQYNRLGTSLTISPWNRDGTSTTVGNTMNGSRLNLFGVGGTSEVTPTGAATNTFSTPVTLSNWTSSTKNILVAMSYTQYSQGQTVDFTGAWTGSIYGGTINGGILSLEGGVADYDGRMRFKFSAANTLTVTGTGITPINQKAAVFARTTVVLNNPDAFGTGNNFSFMTGAINNNTAPGVMNGILATSGNNVAGGILARAGNPAVVGGANPTPNNVAGTVVLGLDGPGSVTFSGNIFAEGSANTSTHSTAARLVLSAPTGGTAIFSGPIQSLFFPTPRTYESPIVIHSGAQGGGSDGTVVLAGLNGYYGKTIVRAGTLLAQGNATNLANVTTSGSVGAGNNTITLASTAGLLPGVMIGQGVAGIPAGTTITAINGNQITLSNNLTATVGNSINLQVGGVFGSATSALSLGDAVPSAITVDYATTLDPAGSFNAGTGQRTGMPTKIDGSGTLAVGTRILVKDSQYDPQRMGIYVVTSSGVWDRAADFNSAAEVLYGTKVNVTNGTLNGGKSFFLTNETFNTSGTLNVTGIGFNPDATNPNVALLTDGAYTIARNIDVTNNQSSGKSTLGGNSAHASTFSGTVSLARGLTVTAATNGSVDFSGDISGGFGVTKEGAGKVIFSAAKSYSGATSVTDGILAVNSTLASSGVTVTGGTLQGTGVITSGVTVGALGTLAPGNSIGTLTVGSADIDGIFNVEVAPGSSSDLLVVVGNLDITNATLDLIDLGGAFDGSTYIIASYGALIGTPQFSAVNGLLNGYVVDYNYQGGNQIALLIPEPATLGLLALGGLMMVTRRNK